MTRETRTLVDLRDVAGLEIECPECGLKIIFPTDKPLKLTPGCPHCNVKWFDELDDKMTGSRRYPALDSFKEIIAHLRALNLEDRTDIHARVRFHITNDPSEEKDVKNEK